MKVELAIAGLGWLLLAFGHTALGLRWILPNLAKEPLPPTPFGGRSLTLAMVRFTWHVVSVMLLAFGVLLIALAFAPHADVRVLLLRWLGAVALVATTKALWDVRRRPSTVLRFPVPVVLALIAAMCWAASA